MDMGLIRGLITLAVFTLFIGIVLWSYSRKRETEFGEAADLPLMGDAGTGMRSEVKVEKIDE